MAEVSTHRAFRLLKREMPRTPSQANVEIFENFDEASLLPKNKRARRNHQEISILMSLQLLLCEKQSPSLVENNSCSSELSQLFSLATIAHSTWLARRHRKSTRPRQ